jgi:hypothetical protein
VKAWTRTVAGYLSDAGLLVEQTDPISVDGWTFIPTDTINLGGLVDEATLEAANAGTTWFAAIQKRRGKNVRDAYVVLPLWLFARLLKRLLGMDPPVCRDCGRAA